VRADAGGEQKVRKILRTTFGRRRKRAMETAGEDVARADIVVCRHDEVRQLRLGGDLPGGRFVFAYDANWP
jgi:hypothetical protein